MTIHLPEDLARYVKDQVRAGRFRSEDDVILDALARHRQAQSKPLAAAGSPDPLLGWMSEDAELMDEIVEQAMNDREERPWRLPPGD